MENKKYDEKTEEQIYEFLDFMEKRKDRNLYRRVDLLEFRRNSKIPRSETLEECNKMELKEICSILDVVADIKDEIITFIKDWIKGLKSELIQEERPVFRILNARRIKKIEIYIKWVDGTHPDLNLLKGTN